MAGKGSATECEEATGESALKPHVVQGGQVRNIDVRCRSSAKRIDRHLRRISARSGGDEGQRQ